MMNKFEQLDDWALLGRKKSSHEAFGILFRRHRDYVFRLAVGYCGNCNLADDVVQEVFVRLYNARELQEQAAFTTYLYRLTLNVTREVSRRNHKSAILHLELACADHDENGEHELRITELETALSGLPPQQREVVTLRFFERKSIKETALVLKCREGTVKSNLHWALNSLRKIFISNRENERED
ncbi:MAG: RNA polymerase sigma factor [Victivallaceae bacterium]|nr:RNA polymerase sigma factor [Victivallaceae bacterium]